MRWGVLEKPIYRAVEARHDIFTIRRVASSECFGDTVRPA
jgi:hypothetical protein